MDELFGIDMDIIAAGAAAATAMIFATLAVLAFRNPVMFKVGLRNIPRRKTQTALIIIGLMLATVIMTAAFSTGDTVASSITDDVYTLTGPVDEQIVWNVEDFPAPEERQLIPLSFVEELKARFEGDEDVAGMMAALREPLPVLSLDTRLNEFSAGIIALDRGPDEDAAFGPLLDVEGNPVHLEGNAIAVNEDLAHAIDAEIGHRLWLLYQGQPVEVVVTAIVPNTILGGVSDYPAARTPGGTVAFSFLSELTGKGENADAILVTNAGDARSGLKRTDAVVAKLEAALEGTPYRVEPIKQDGIEIAQQVGSVFTTIFVVFGLFSIAAGVLLIFLIFIMLAAERKPEMGIARAVGAKRRHLVEAFLAEGMGYDLGSAVVGVFLGMGVTVLMVALVNSFSDEGGLGISFRVAFTWRGLLTAFCLGIIATFLVITAASVNAARLNIVAAIRDLPETKQLNPEQRTWRGYLRGTLNAMVAFGYVPVCLSAMFLVANPVVALLSTIGVVVGLVGPFVYLLRAHNFGAPARERVEGERIPIWPFFVVPGLSALLYALALVLVRLTRDRRPEQVPMWLVVAAIVIPPLGLVLAALQHRRRPVAWSAGAGVVAAVVGALFIALSLENHQAFFYMAGVSLVLLWVALTLRFIAVAERLTFTVVSFLVLFTWYAPSGWFEWLVGDMQGDIEMFFLAGIVMVTAGTFILVYNADLIIPVVASQAERLGRIVPAVKTAVAYPLVARMRTGLTIAMIGLIMFALVMIATLNNNFAAIFLGNDAKGGFDVRVVVNANNPIEDPASALEEAGVDASPIRAIAENRIAWLFETEIRDPAFDPSRDDKEFKRYTVIGADETFFAHTAIQLRRMAAGYKTDREVWEALARDPTLAVIPSQITQAQDGFGGPGEDELLTLDLDLEPGFEPFTIDLRDPGTRTITTVTVIGQMEDHAEFFWPGIVVRRDTLLAAFPDSRTQVYYLALEPGTDAEAMAKRIEAGLVQAGADSLDAILDEQRAAQSSFLLLFQGFMGLGLVVGIAALGVIAFRSVVERRQQIGMLRAIGYQRSMVALSFLFESGFVALSGIGLGLVLGLSLSWVLFTSGEISESSEGAPFVVPWLSLAVISAIAFSASMLMTLIPARSASRVAVAEALRYE